MMAGSPSDGMEPMLILASSSHRAALSDKVMALTQRAAEFRSRLPEGSSNRSLNWSGNELLLLQSHRGT